MRIFSITLFLTALKYSVMLVNINIMLTWYIPGGCGDVFWFAFLLIPQLVLTCLLSSWAISYFSQIFHNHQRLGCGLVRFSSTHVISESNSRADTLIQEKKCSPLTQNATGLIFNASHSGQLGLILVAKMLLFLPPWLLSVHIDESRGKSLFVVCQHCLAFELVSCTGSGNSFSGLRKLHHNGNNKTSQVADF